MRRLLFAMLLPALACSSADLPACPNGTTLSNGVCRPRCAGDEECTLNEECTDGVCVPYVGVSDAGPIDVGMIGCTKDQDCPNGPSGPWSSCEFDDPCDMSGRRSRVMRRGSCSEGLCGITETTQPMACPRDTNGQTCGDPQVGPWGPCENPNACEPDGTMIRMSGVPTCNEGRCEISGRVEQQSCMRPTEGVSCGPGKVYGNWSNCMFNDVCGSAGQRYRTVDTFTCMSGSCGSISEQEVDQQTCVQPPALDGTSCSNDAHCCSGVCTQRGDPQNCNACGIACASGRACVPIIAGDGTAQWACQCGELSDCRGYYGPSSDCVSTSGLGVCTCQCPAQDCSGECAAGLCHTPPGLGYCGY